jgi:hypothetical protein
MVVPLHCVQQEGTQSIDEIDAAVVYDEKKGKLYLNEKWHWQRLGCQEGGWIARQVQRQARTQC